MVKEWQKIETAPKDGRHFIAFTSLGQMLFTAHWDQEDQRWYTDYERWGGVMTHWMPLPEPPAQEGCFCHLGSVCGEACKAGKHHGGCPVDLREKEQA